MKLSWHYNTNTFTIGVKYCLREKYEEYQQKRRELHRFEQSLYGENLPKIYRKQRFTVMNEREQI